MKVQQLLLYIYIKEYNKKKKYLDIPWVFISWKEGMFCGLGLFFFSYTVPLMSIEL